MKEIEKFDDKENLEAQTEVIIENNEYTTEITGEKSEFVFIDEFASELRKKYNKNTTENTVRIYVRELKENKEFEYEKHVQKIFNNKTNRQKIALDEFARRIIEGYMFEKVAKIDSDLTINVLKKQNEALQKEVKNLESLVKNIGEYKEKINRLDKYEEDIKLITQKNNEQEKTIEVLNQEKEQLSQEKEKLYKEKEELTSKNEEKEAQIENLNEIKEKLESENQAIKDENEKQGKKTRDEMDKKEKAKEIAQKYKELKELSWWKRAQRKEFEEEIKRLEEELKEKEEAQNG